MRDTRRWRWPRSAAARWPRSRCGLAPLPVASPAECSLDPFLGGYLGELERLPPGPGGAALHRVPHQAWIEAKGGKHCHNDDRGKADSAESGIDGGDLTATHQADQGCQHEHVDHGPPPDELNDA